GVPVYFQSVLSDGTAEGRREAFFLIGGFLALWIIAYGAVQALAPRLLGARGQAEADPLHARPCGILGRRPGTLADRDPDRGPPAFRLRLRGQFLDPFLPDPRLRRRRPDHPRRGLLLHGQ